MINEIYLKNFKPFEDQKFILKSLNLLSGLNGSGKSSFIQSLLLLRQSYQQELLPEKGLALNGELVNIGNAQDALYEYASEDLMSFKIFWKDSKIGEWKFQYNSTSEIMELIPEQNNSQIYKSSLFDKNFVYLQSDRMSPHPYFEISDFQVKQLNQIGKQGEYAAYFFSLYQNQDIPNQRLSHKKADSLSLKNQVEAWMSEISPGTRIDVNMIVNLSLASLQYSYEYQYGTSNFYRPTNVGFGITVIFPILVAILWASKDTLILLENPEVYLHPKGQSHIGQLLALAASCGIQIIVETHSDHILNGIRLAVHRQDLNPDDVAIHYFQREEKDGKIQTKVISPRMYRDGGIDRWPDGFFDQAEKDLMELL